MNIEPIKTRRDYRRALKRIKRLMTAKRGTPEGDCLDALVTRVEAWERRHYPLPSQPGGGDQIPYGSELRLRTIPLKTLNHGSRC